jgi:DNA-binding HxlR family transcriptional regulator
MTNRPGPICPKFHAAVELIGKRWTGAIIRTLLPGPVRYAAIRAAIPDINDRMLCERLRELELEGIVHRQVVPDTPVRVEYALTAKGAALETALAAISAWADRWVELTPRPADSGDSR